MTIYLPAGSRKLNAMPPTVRDLVNQFSMSKQAKVDFGGEPVQATWRDFYVTCTLPKTIADRGVRVSTRKKLVDERKPSRNKRLTPAKSET